MLGLARGLAGVYREPPRLDGQPYDAAGLACPVCGSRSFHIGEVPAEWPELFEHFDADPGELDVLHLREHLFCTRCKSNLRVMALATALLDVEHWRSRGPTAMNLATLLATRPWLRLLEINETHVIGTLLRRLPRHVAADYPDVDAQALPFDDASFRLVVHSDTLEHVPDPDLMLRECARVLRPGAAMVFTVPTRPGRVTASRAGKPDVFHGDKLPPYRSLVHTDFGADLWTPVLAAGFADLLVVSLLGGAGLAYVATKP